jgi:hypothetical protein
LGEKEGEWKFVESKGRKNRDGAACGVYACAHAYALTRGEDTKDVSTAIPKDSDDVDSDGLDQILRAGSTQCTTEQESTVPNESQFYVQQTARSNNTTPNICKLNKSNVD